MRIKLLLSLMVFFSLNIFAQQHFTTSNNKSSNNVSSNFSSKHYFGISAAYSIPGSLSLAGFDDGIDLGLIHYGYRFNDSWGATLNFNSSGYNVDYFSVGIAQWSVGPMYTISVNQSLFLDIKPMYVPSMVAVYSGIEGLNNFLIKGTGILLGNSLVFGESRGFKFSINVDYLFGNWKKVSVDEVTFPYSQYSYDSEISKLNIGIGARYNF